MEALKEAAKACASLFYRHRQGRADIFIHSTQRSGSTLLFDLFASESGSKAVGEPFQERKRAVIRRFLSDIRSRYPAFNESSAEEVRTYVNRLLSGAFVGGYERSYNPRSVRHHRLTDHNVVKLLRTLNCTEWFVREYPYARHILLVRHPAPTALSRARNGWHAPIQDFVEQREWFDSLSPEQKRLIQQLNAGELFQQHLAVWILEHAFLEHAHATLRQRRVPILAYEHLIGRRSEAAAWLSKRFGLSDADTVATRLAQPSRSVRHSGTSAREALREDNSEALVGRWKQQIGKTQLRLLKEALGTFGITAYSHDHPFPHGWLAEPPW